MSTSAPKEKQAPSGVSMKLALAADGDVADTLAAAAAAAAADEAGDEHPDPNQAASPNGPGGKRNSFSNPLDLLAGLASGHHDQEGSDAEGEQPSGDSTKAAAKASEQNTTASAPKKKRKLLMPVKPVGAKVADDFKVIHSAVGNVPAASSKDFAISNNDVLSGRGGLTNHHPGNILFRNLIKAKQADYIRANRHEKEYIARDIVAIMKKLDPPGRFLKKDPKDPNKWIEIDDKQAKQKAKQALRDIPNPALPVGPGAVPVVPPVPVANPALIGGAATVPPGSAPAVAAAGGNAVTPLTLSPASSTVAAAPGAVSGSNRPQPSVAPASEGEAKEQ